MACMLMKNKDLPTHPLQTRAWADFRRSWGNEVIKAKYGYLTLHKLPFINKKIGMFIRGPKPTAKMLADLKKIARKQNLIFVKLEPFVAYSDSSMQRAESRKQKDKLIKMLKNQGCVRGKTLFTPTSFWIDLTKSEEELMSEFHKKTRYNIRYAARKGVSVEEDNSDEAFDAYLNLMRKTVERQGFYAHSEKYHQLMWKHLHTKPLSFGHDPLAHLLVAKHKGKIHAAWILFKHDGFLYYPYGASSFEKKYLQANSAMMWGAIQFGKKHKLKTFDLWGREPGKGFTRFKEGFNPEVVEFIGTWDLVINKNLYWIYRVLEFGRWQFLRAKSRFVKPKF